MDAARKAEILTPDEIASDNADASAGDNASASEVSGNNIETQVYNALIKFNSLNGVLNNQDASTLNTTVNVDENIKVDNTTNTQQPSNPFPDPE